MLRATMHWRRVLGAACLLSAVALASSKAQATIVERIVAVVGDQAILLSDLRTRARPFVLRISQQVPGEAQRAAATSQLYNQLVERMVEEKLQERAASRANLTVTAREIDDALQRIAAQNKVTVEVVIQEAARSGLDERAYRQEIRRQLLEAKLLNVRVQGRIRVTEGDMEAAYQKLVQEERRELPFRAAWIRVSAPRMLSSEAQQRRRALAESVAGLARSGADFRELARKHSDDASTRGTGGVLPRMQLNQLPAPLRNTAAALEVGQVSEPVRDGDDLVILAMMERDPSQLPAYEDARAELSQRVYMDKMEKARQHWMEGLKRQIHVDVRL